MLFFFLWSVVPPLLLLLLPMAIRLVQWLATFFRQLVSLFVDWQLCRKTSSIVLELPIKESTLALRAILLTARTPMANTASIYTASLNVNLFFCRLPSSFLISRRLHRFSQKRNAFDRCVLASPYLADGSSFCCRSSCCRCVSTSTSNSTTIRSVNGNNQRTQKENNDCFTDAAEAIGSAEAR